MYTTSGTSGYICPTCNEWVEYGQAHSCGDSDKAVPMQYVFAPWEEILMYMRQIISLLERVEQLEIERSGLPTPKVNLPPK